jgi:hypothetical protein
MPRRRMIATSGRALMTNGWTWANLSDDQLQLLAEAEKSLGAEYLLVYKPTDHSSRAVEARVRDLEAAPLNESQLEYLSGLESQIGAVVVAYTDKASA